MTKKINWDMRIISIFYLVIASIFGWKLETTLLFILCLLVLDTNEKIK